MSKQITATAIFGAIIGVLVIVFAFQVDVPPRTPNPVVVLPPPAAPPPAPSYPWTSPPPVFPPQSPNPEPGEPTPLPVIPPAPQLPPPAPTAPSGPVSQLLSLPAVQESELVISPSGADTFSAYLEAFATRGSELSFDGTKFDALPQNAGGFPLLVDDLVDAAIRTGGFALVRAPLAIYEEFIAAKVAWEKTLPVRGDAVAVNKTMIGVDLLTLDLIRKAYAVADGALARSEFEQRYRAYQATINFYRDKLRREGGTAYQGPAREPSGFTKLLRVFGLSPEIARAVGVQFGGFITFTRSCNCIGGYTMYLTPGYVPAPLAPAVLFLSNAVAFSPAIFMNYAPVVGHWVLGAFAPAPHPCFNNPPDCNPAGLPAIGNVIMAGTS